ncbi:MAG: hypothetical protein WA432_04155 [Candidatus Babeliaceae bacterium]
MRKKIIFLFFMVLQPVSANIFSTYKNITYRLPQFFNKIIISPLLLFTHQYVQAPFVSCKEYFRKIIGITELEQKIQNMQKQSKKQYSLFMYFKDECEIKSRKQQIKIKKMIKNNILLQKIIKQNTEGLDKISSYIAQLTESSNKILLNQLSFCKSIKELQEINLQINNLYKHSEMHKKAELLLATEISEINNILQQLKIFETQENNMRPDDIIKKTSQKSTTGLASLLSNISSGKTKNSFFSITKKS